MNKLNYTDMLAQLGISSAHPGGLALSKWNFLKEKITKDMKILDLGCGTGKTAAYLASTYKCSVTALDVHPIMLEKAKTF
ncbi:methyltransferase domain-containing protein [Anaerobacillus sp. HL2]|nr:methyltransferase domain-containing protein [Anaerobacillus sp. HL2]